MSEASQIAEIPRKRTSLVEKIAGRYSIDAEKLLDTLKATAFRQSDGSAPTNEQMAALLVVADQYGLNPFTKEIYAFSDKRAGIVPVVGVDGWSRIINEHPASDGFDFRESEKTVVPEHGKLCPEWLEVIIHRKDRAHPMVVREYIDEVYRPPFMKDGRALNGPWQTHTKRMFRHKVLIQGARIAYGFTGIYDEDEAERIVEMGTAEIVSKRIMITDDPIDEDKVFANSVWFREMIDIDQVEENYAKVQEAWKRLSVNEQMAVHEKLSDKIPGNKNGKLYRNALKEYLSYVPSEHELRP